MELTEAWVLRSTSVSSSRRTIVPPFRRAYSQLNMKVRALPTCRNPVGDGANRTRSITREYSKLDSSGIWVVVRRALAVRPAGAANLKSNQCGNQSWRRVVGATDYAGTPG